MSVAAGLLVVRRGPRRLDLLIVGALFLLPTLVGMAVFQWFPLAVAVRNSTLSFSPLNPDAARFVGLGNYVTLLGTARFQHAAINTMLYIGGKLLIQLPLGMGLAMLVNRPLRGATIARGAVFAALVASDAVIALIWNLLYTPDTGLFNVLLRSVGLARQPFLISTTEALPSILAMVIWKDLGLTVLILLAGLHTIPREFTEAAAIDGAGAWAQLWCITLPLLRRMLLLATFMATIGATRVFTPILLMTEGGPRDATVNAIYYMYEQAFQYQQMGLALATAVLVIVALLGITLVQGRLLRSQHEY